MEHATTKQQQCSVLELACCLRAALCEVPMEDSSRATSNKDSLRRKTKACQASAPVSATRHPMQTRVHSARSNRRVFQYSRVHWMGCCSKPGTQECRPSTRCTACKLSAPSRTVTSIAPSARQARPPARSPGSHASTERLTGLYGGGFSAFSLYHGSWPACGRCLRTCGWTSFVGQIDIKPCHQLSIDD